MSLRWFAIALTLIVIVSVAVVISTYHVFSQTADEPIHLAAGFQWLAGGKCDLDVEHPPLARIFFALEPFFAHAKAAEGTAVDMGNSLLYRNDRYSQNLSRVRAGNLPFFIVAIVVTGIWAARLFGEATGLVAAALLALLPNVLAHAGLATTDMAATATTIIALFFLARWLQHPSWIRALLLGITVGAGLVSKFSFPVFFVAGAVAFVLTSDVRLWRSVAQIAAVFVIALLLVWALYRFDVGTLRVARAGMFAPDSAPDVASRYAMNRGYEWVRADLVERYREFANDAAKHGASGVDFVDWAKAAGYSSPAAGRHGNTMSGAPSLRAQGIAASLLEPFRRCWQWIAVHVPLPAPLFVVGAEVVRYHAAGHHLSFLLGRFRDDGWWYYFPVVFFFKTPLPFLVLMAVGALLLVRSQKGEALGVALAPPLMLLPALASSLDIGVRHILPLMPLLAMIAAYGFREMWRWRRMGRIAAATLAAWSMFVPVRTDPDYLSYFNECAGSHPELIASDSNLDWGQDLLRLADVVRRLNIVKPHVAYFGSADVQRHIPGAQKLAPGEVVDGTVAVSEMKFAYGTPEEREGFAWLNSFTPSRKVGHSIRLYFIPPHG